jgi:hypothetical protein
MEIRTDKDGGNTTQQAMFLSEAYVVVILSLNTDRPIP